MDFPSPHDFNLLVSTAKDRQQWRSLGDSILKDHWWSEREVRGGQTEWAAHRAPEQSAGGSRGVAAGGAADVAKAVTNRHRKIAGLRTRVFLATECLKE